MDEVDQLAQEGALHAQGMLAEAVPPATAPLPAEVVNALGSTLVQAWGELTGGQAAEPQFERVSGEVDQLPADLFAPLFAISALLQEVPGGEAYAMDIEQLVTTPEGIDQLTHLLSGASRDKRLVRAIANHAPADAGGDTDTDADADAEPQEESVEDLVGQLNRG